MCINRDSSTSNNSGKVRSLLIKRIQDREKRGDEILSGNSDAKVQIKLGKPLANTNQVEDQQDEKVTSTSEFTSLDVSENTKKALSKVMKYT